MKFDFVIGNPPYQTETVGEQKNFASSIYPFFMDSAYSISDKVELITPARFLFNVGNTSKTWNKKMLSDNHFKVLHFEMSSKNVFPNTDIKGGVAITYRDSSKDFGAIDVFTSFDELNKILNKVKNKIDRSMSDIIYVQNRFNSDVLFKEHPECKSQLGSEGKDLRLESNIFEKTQLFFDTPKSDNDLEIVGISNLKRVRKYINQNYISKNHENLSKYKVLIPASNGSGALGEVLSTPLIGTPLIGYTRSFIGIGAFEQQDVAENCMKYVKTKFARAMLGVLKVTQGNKGNVWKYVPVQDFTDESDIDWGKSIAEIDQQLYMKYGLTEDEISFIESHVKEME